MAADRDQVIAPAYTFPATASPFAFDGIAVIFADADAYGNVTAAAIADRMAPNVRAVIVTHMWGSPCAMDEIAAYCRARGLLLLEDCSHAHFASWHGARVGTLADMAVFSTNQKAVTTGEGGILVTRHDRLRELALLYGHYNKRGAVPSSTASPGAWPGTRSSARSPSLRRTGSTGCTWSACGSARATPP